MNNFLLLILLIIVEFLNLGFFNYMILFIIMEIIFTIAVYVIVKNITGRIRFYINFSIISQVLKFSVPIGLASVIGVLSVQIDKLIIGMIYTTEDLAIYTNAARALPFTIIAASLTAVLMPHLVKLLKANRITDSIKLWSDANIISYAIISFFAFNLVVFAPDVLTLLYSEKYLPGVNVFRVYSVVLLLRFTYFGIILNSIGKTKHIMYGSLFSLLLNVGLSFLLYKVFGFVGPAIATLISLSSVALYQLVVTSKILNVKFKNILPWSHIIQTTMINLGLGTFFAYVHKYHFQNISSVYYSLGKSIIFASIWGIVYILIMKKRVFLSWNNLKNVNTSNIESLGNEVNYEKNG
jgi:O-antigen/teichoic acid export membrane protein